MNWIISLIFWFIGLFLSSFTIIPILIIFVFGIPITKKLEKANLLKENHGIIKGYFISVVLLSTIYLIALSAIKTFLPTGFIGFIGGMIFSLLFGLGQVGKNKNNISDYLQTNEKHFKGTPQEIANVLID